MKEKEQTQLRRKRLTKKSNNMIKRVLFYGVIIFIILLSILIGINAFFNTYYFEFQTPIIIQTPIMLKTREGKVEEVKEVITPLPLPTATPSAQLNIVSQVQANRPTEEQIVLGKVNGELLWKIYQLESQRGKEDGCRENGKFNGFGYGQNSSVWNCFDSFEEVAYKVSNWFTIRLNEGKSISEAICYYNTGKVSLNCDYYQKYMRVR